MKPWLASATGLAAMAAALATKPPSVDDFPAFYNAAHHPGAAYSGALHQTAAHFLPFLRIPSYAWMLQPVAAFPYPVARVLWLILIAAALGCFAFFWPGERRANATALCWSVPVAFGFALGQDTSFILLIATVAVLLWRRNREFPAGIALSLLAIKITFLAAVAIPFLRSRRAATGLAIGLAVQMGFSFAFDPRWLSEYLAVLRSPALDREPLKMLSIRAITSVLPLSEAVFAAGFIALLVWMWRFAARAPIAGSVAAALAIALIAAPHCYVYDGVLLIPLLAGRATLSTWSGRAALFGLSPIPFLAILAGGSRAVTLGGSSLLIVGVWVVLNYRRTESAAFTTNPLQPSLSLLTGAARPESADA